MPGYGRGSWSRRFGSPLPRPAASRSCSRTTRDEPDYDKLMTLAAGHPEGARPGPEGDPGRPSPSIDPLPGAKEFLDELRTFTQVIILSDTFEQFAKPLMEKLGWPTIFCNTLEVAPDGAITGYRMRCPQSKLTTVKALQSMGYETIASRGQLQRPGHDPGQQGGLPVQEHPGRSGPTTRSCPPLRSSASCWKPSRGP